MSTAPLLLPPFRFFSGLKKSLAQQILPWDDCPVFSGPQGFKQFIAGSCRYTLHNVCQCLFKQQVPVFAFILFIGARAATG
jgi:hypothetical protein